MIYKQITCSHDVYNRLTGISTPDIIDFSYDYNNKSQLTWRDEKYYVDGSWKGLKEKFTYDPSNRLSTVSVVDPVTQIENETLRMNYNSSINDRIESKSDVATSYSYDPDPAKHQLQGITTVAGYEPPNHSIRYTAEGKIDYIEEGNKKMAFEYGVDDQRFKSTYTEGGTEKQTKYYYGNYEKVKYAEEEFPRQLNYIYAGDNLVAIFEQKYCDNEMYYVYTDYLGSIRCLTDGNGNIVKTLGFDAWGNRRDPFNGQLFTSYGGADIITSCGFTGHEHMDEFGLINMNGRVYDPMLGIFLSPDNYLQQPDNTQNFNKYSYCLNNPLMYTDPSGDFFEIVIAAMMMGHMSGMNSLGQGGDYWGSFGRGASISLVSSAVSIGTSNIIGAGGLGLVPGATYGAIGGAVGGGITGGLEAWLSHGNIMNGILQGSTQGAISGAIVGGCSGYDRADELGFDPLTGVGKNQKAVPYGTPSGTPTGIGENDIKFKEKLRELGYNPDKIARKYNIEEMSVNGGPRNASGEVLFNGESVAGLTNSYSSGWSFYQEVYISNSAANDMALFEATWGHEINHCYLFYMGIHTGSFLSIDLDERVCYDYTISKVGNKNLMYEYMKIRNINFPCPNYPNIDKYWKLYLSPFLKK